MTNEMTSGDNSARVFEVATNQLSVHSKQAELSPEMRDKDWTKFLAGVKKNGILQPISITKGNRVIDGKNRLKAAQLLGYENVRVVIEDIPEDEIATYITETKLSRDELTRGQRAAIVINLYYEVERAKAKLTQGNRTDIAPEVEQSSGRVNEILAKKSGVGKSNIAYLLAVKRSRPDLFAKVFSGEYAIGRAHTEMKKDEEPEHVEEEKPIEVEKQVIEAIRKQEEKLPQIDESQPTHSLDNRIVQMRKNALTLTAEVLDESDKLKDTKKEVRDSAKEQLLSLTRASVIALGQNAENDKEAETLALIYELLNKLQEED